MVAMLVVAAWVVACVPAPPGAPRDGARSASSTDVRIEVWPEPGATPGQYTLRCDPPRGTVRDPAAACGRIAALVGTGTGTPALLAPPARGGETVCTQIYGGPARAVVRGTIGGVPVDVTLTRRDGCEIDRYDRMMALLGVPS